MMRGRRSVYVVIFLIAAIGAATLVYLNQPRAEIVRARDDIPILTPISADQLELVRVSPADAAPNVARSIDAVVGRYAAIPILAGQDVDLRALEDNPGQQAFGFGAPIGPGQVAFALPVDPAAAIGGAIAPGARVDIVAVPKRLGTGSFSGSGAETESGTLIGQGLLVLAVRTTDGQPLVQADAAAGSGRVVVPPKIGAVVVAIPAARVTEFGTASVTSSFVLALSPEASGVP